MPGFSVLYTLLILVIYPLLADGETMTPGSSVPAAVFYLTTALFPALTIGVAVLRHRLWDIDLIIRRTLVYSILTISLTAVYFFQLGSAADVLPAVRPAGSPPVATVISTLAIAALFTPFRRQIQGFIDRRFYRRKYDSERVLDLFRRTLREEVDLDNLTESILNVVEYTMQPAHVALQLREGESGRE